MKVYWGIIYLAHIFYLIEILIKLLFIYNLGHENRSLKVKHPQHIVHLRKKILFLSHRHDISIMIQPDSKLKQQTQELQVQKKSKKHDLTLILLFTTTPTFANSVDPDQMASEEAI